MSKANFTNANLTNAILSETSGLTVAQLQSARTYDDATLSPELQAELDANPLAP